MKSRLVRRLHVTHEKRNLRKHYTALRFNAGGTADNDDDIPSRDTSMYSRADFYVYNRYSSREEKEEKNMEYLTGVKPKETKEISELLEQAEAGAKVKVNGAVHTIRDMGTVAFVILRKREGLLQCVYEEGSADFELKDIKEAATVEVERRLRRE